MLAFSTNVPKLFSPTRGRPITESRRRRAKYATPRRSVPKSLAKKPSTKPNAGDKNDFLTPVYGMKLPDLSAEDQAYLDEATSEKDFMRRMTRIAHQLDQKRKVDSVRENRQTPDDYLEGLSKLAKERDAKYMESVDDDVISEATQPPPVQAESPPVAEVIEPEIETADVEVDNAPEQEESMEDVEARIEELNRKLMEAANQDGRTGNEAIDESGPEIEYSDEIAAEAQRKMETLQKEIHREIGTEPPSMSRPTPQARNKSEPVKTDTPAEMSEGSNPKVVDRQIEYLESYVSKLKREAEKDGDAEKLAEMKEGSAENEDSAEGDDASSKGVSLVGASKDENTHEDVGRSAKFEGLENTPGEMSASEKQAAFEALRQRATERKAEMSNDFADPFNVTLPKKRSSGVSGDFRGQEEVVSEDYEGDSDVPMGDADEYDSFGSMFGDKNLLVEEIESEMHSYTGEAKRLLLAHESRMNMLITRLRAGLAEDGAEGGTEGGAEGGADD